MRFATLTILLVGLISLFVQLGARDFWPPDEARYGRVSWEMRRGSPVIPHLNGVVYPDKPPGYFWVVSAGAWLSGHVDEATARWPSALGALVMVFLVTRAAGRVAGPRGGFLAGGLLLSTGWFFWKARNAQIDVLFASLIGGALLLWFDAVQERRPRAVLGGALFLSAAVLVKGPLALVALPVVFAWRAVSGKPPADARSLVPWCGAAVAVFFLPLVAWLTWAVSEQGWDYLRAMVGDHVVERAQVGKAHVRPWWYYLSKLPLILMPWVLLLPLWASRALRGRLAPEARRLAAFAVLWSVVFVVVQSCFPGKRSIYLFTVFPPFALLAGVIAQACAVDSAPRWPRRWVGIVVGTIAVILLAIGGPLLAAGISASAARGALDLFGEKAASGYASLGLPELVDGSAWSRHLRIAGMSFLAAGAAGLASLVRRRLDLAIDLTVFGLPLAFAAATGFVVPHLDASRSRRALAEEVSTAVGGAPIAVFRHLDEGLVFYLQRPRLDLIEPTAPIVANEGDDDAFRQRECDACESELERRYAAGEAPFCLIRTSDRERLTRLVEGVDYDVVLSRIVGSRRRYDLIAPRVPEAPR